MSCAPTCSCCTPSSRVVIVASVGEVGNDEKSSARGEKSLSSCSLPINPSFGDAVAALGSIRSGVVTSVPSSLFASILASTEDGSSSSIAFTLLFDFGVATTSTSSAGCFVGVFIGDFFLEGEIGGVFFADFCSCASTSTSWRASFSTESCVGVFVALRRIASATADTSTPFIFLRDFEFRFFDAAIFNRAIAGTDAAVPDLGDFTIA